MSERVRFTFEGRPLWGVAGQSLGAALHAAGIRVLSTSARYHRPRGLHCVAGTCPSCSVRVDGLPGVAACTVPLRGGEVVERDRRGPSPGPLLDRLSALAPAGFAYALFPGSPRLWRRAERVLARLAGAGRLPDPQAAAGAGGFELRRADVVVVGGGAEGLGAAAGQARAGHRVLLVERDRELGGRLLAEPGGRGRALALEARAREAGAELLTAATAIGWYDEGLLGVVTRDGLLAVEPSGVVLATGSHELSLPFEDGDRPGILLAGGAQRLLVRDGVPCGRNVLVAARGARGEALATLLRAAGARVSVVDLATTTLERAHGNRAVTGVTVRDPSGSRRIRCDAVCIAAGTRPADELALQLPPGLAL
ncbi:MAG: (2Fe-2S)-binding protein [Thermoleophilia bacterium]|nr:(2Fe-2S)-binding protein [Thermoleophilia bacterium]